METDAYATTQQTITVEEKSVYEISVWAKSESCTPDGLSITFAEEDAEVVTNVITLPAGRYDWTLVTGTFETPEFSRGEPLAPMLLSLVSKGVADIWLDDIQIRRVTDVLEKNDRNM